jgi:hypothetical protein
MVRGQGRERAVRQLRDAAVTAKPETRNPKPETNQKVKIENRETEAAGVAEKVEPMAIKTEQSKENAYLIRELEAFCGRKFPSDVDLRYRAALEKRLYQLLPDLDVPQLVRMIEATCGIDFPNAVDRNFHDQVMERLGRAHHLKDVRLVTIPGHWVNDRKGRAVPAARPGLTATGRGA